MSAKHPELHVRDQTKVVLKHLENGEIDEAQNVILQNKDILRYNFGLVNFVPLIPRIRFSKIIPKNYDALKMVIDTGFQIYQEEENELLFFAAAKCDEERLTFCVNKICEKNPDGINQVREGDTALMFLIKYGNVANEKYPNCMKILIDAGIDINRNDYHSHNPTGFLLNLYSRFSKTDPKEDNNIVLKNLKECIQMLLRTNSVDFSLIESENLDMNILEKEFDLCDDQKQFLNKEEQLKDKLFKYLIKGDEKSFIRSKDVLKLLDSDDGNNTFLQLCCEKNLKEAAKFLITKGADITKVTERNQKTPLELAARRNNFEIFQDILNQNKITIDKELFLTFLRARPKHIKAKYFDEILKYKRLDLNIRSNNGNTPLHYAIILSSSEAVGVLLQRGASLTVKNDSKKCPLDYISAEDLENYLNKCIMRDSYNDINNGKYELALNYRNLIETDESHVTSELAIVERICNSPKLCYLVNHPLIASFIDIKWKLVEPLYRNLFIFHVMFYVVTILCFINLNLLNYLALPLAFIYGAKIWEIFNWKNNKLHESVDIAITLIIIISFFIPNNVNKYQLGVIATSFMALSFHMFWRYSPNFSQFHAILINILSQLFAYLFYVMSLLLFFGAASYIYVLVRNENENSNQLFNDLKMVSPYFYLLCAFGAFVCVMIIMTIINSVTFLQENSGNILNNFQILGCKNTLIFLKCIEDFYLTKYVFLNKYFYFMNKLIGNPFIFDDTYLKEKDEVNENSSISKKKERKVNRNKNTFLVNFYINSNKFSFEKLLWVKLSSINVSRMKKAIS